MATSIFHGSTSAINCGKRTTPNWTGDCGRVLRARRPVSTAGGLEVHGAAGRPLTVIVRDEGGHVVRADSAMPLAPAEKTPLTEERCASNLAGWAARLRSGRAEKSSVWPGAAAGQRVEPAATRRWWRNWNSSAPRPALAAWPTPPVPHQRRPARRSRPRRVWKLAPPRARQPDRVGPQLRPVRSGAASAACAPSIASSRTPKNIAPRSRNSTPLLAAQLEAGNPKPAIFVAPPRIFKAGR